MSGIERDQRGKRSSTGKTKCAYNTECAHFAVLPFRLSSLADPGIAG